MILTDQGSNFVSEVFTNVCKFLKIKKVKTTAYHPQFNGVLERTHSVS
jgi:transposase InsO family protein